MTRMTLAAVTLILVVVAAAPAAPASQTDDGWRRTAQGWERMDLAARAFAAPAKPAEPAARFDTHPAALVLVQLLAVLGAMVVFPRPNVVRVHWPSGGWLAVFRRSFRASVFGA